MEVIIYLGVMYLTVYQNLDVSHRHSSTSKHELSNLGVISI